MSSCVVIIKNNDEVSWDDIRKVIQKAHQNNLSRGLVVSTTKMSSEQLKCQLGDGVCFLAIKNHPSADLKAFEILGVAAIKIHNVYTWYANGKVAHFMYDAVLPEYFGTGIYRALQDARYDYVRDHGISCITTSTAEKNYRMKKILRSQGFSAVRFFSVYGLEHYSIRWAKWLDKKPYPHWYIKVRYMCSMLFTKMKFTSSHSKQFGK